MSAKVTGLITIATLSITGLSTLFHLISLGTKHWYKSSTPIGEYYGGLWVACGNWQFTANGTVTCKDFSDVVLTIPDNLEAARGLNLFALGLIIGVILTLVYSMWKIINEKNTLSPFVAAAILLLLASILQAVSLGFAGKWIKNSSTPDVNVKFDWSFSLTCLTPVLYFVAFLLASISGSITHRHNGGWSRVPTTVQEI